MEDFKGTKGEWHPVEFAGWIHIMNEPFYDAQDILDIDHVGEDVANANANLIASAPDLFEALKGFVHSCYVGCSKEELETLRINAEKAINKALGK